MGKEHKRERGHKYSQQAKSEAKPGKGLLLIFFVFFYGKNHLKHTFFRWNNNNTVLVDNAVSNMNRDARIPSSME